MRGIIYILVSLFFLSCGQDKDNRTLHHNEDVESSIEKKQSPLMEPTVDMLFLGHHIQCSSQELPLEFARICRADDNLSYDSITQNVAIYGTTFHLNCTSQGFMLMTSVQPDTKQIKKVRDAIIHYHGEENFVEDWHYSWLPFTDSTKIGLNYPIIHLRRVRSEAGGTVIIVD